MKKHFFYLGYLMLALISCKKDRDELSVRNDKDESTTSVKESEIKLAAHSITPNFLTLKSSFSNVKIYPLISSEDQLEQSPNFVYGSMADGGGLIKNADGNYYYINNAEADYSVMRITLDKTFKPVKGEYILNSEGTANLAQCSGTLATPEEHGFGPLYLSGGEWTRSDIAGAPTVFATNPLRAAKDASLSSTYNHSMGEWTVENAVPLNKDAYPGKTIIMIGDDSHGKAGGQLAMYVSDKVGDLNKGKLYALKMVTSDIVDNDLIQGKSYDVEFEEIKERTYDEINKECIRKKIMAFNRIEDIDYRKGSAENNREIYFNATGKDRYNDTRTKYGRTYKLILEKNNPLKGKLTLVLDGDNPSGKARMFTSPDNITVTQNYAYIQEDPNSFTDDDGLRVHSAQLYQYNLNTGEVKTVLEINQKDMAMNKDRFGNAFATATDRQGANELSGMIDISDIIGVPDTFIIIIQCHTWHNEKFLNPDQAGSNEDSSDEGSVAYLLQGLAR